ncbi:MAG: polyprenyl synthetase family protein [Anaerolineae bacterium]
MQINSRMRLFASELRKRREKVYDYLTARKYVQRFAPEHIRNSVYSYIESSGKSLRPAVLLLSCGAVGGDEDKALPAAAAVEVYHTWTLVHDDIIDRDEKRRGRPSLHAEFCERAIEELGYTETEARHYGMSIAILAGDVQQGWSVSLLCELYSEKSIDPCVVLYLIDNLKMQVQSTLVEGETLDIQYSKRFIESLNERLIVDMLWKKTGVLYEFAGRAGAVIGLNSCDSNNELVKELSAFASKCGIAFQLQDDILGIVGDEDLLGKPVGSDLREGKRTTIVYYALNQANSCEKARLLDILGKEQATIDEVTEAVHLLRRLGGIEYTKSLARSYVNQAIPHLDRIPDSRYKDLLSMWAEYLITREF